MYDFKNKEILFLGAHPDDIEIGCLGLIYRLSEVQIQNVILQPNSDNR